MLARATAKNTEQQIQQSEDLRKQAEETARQGKTLMVFTVVTIIFVRPAGTQIGENPRSRPSHSDQMTNPGRGS